MACSMLWMGRLLVKASDVVLDAGLALMEGATARLTSGRPTEGEG